MIEYFNIINIKLLTNKKIYCKYKMEEKKEKYPDFVAYHFLNPEG